VSKATAKQVRLSMSTNIIDRKRTDEARRLLASIVESANDAIIGEDLDGNVISWNKGAESLYGFTAEEAIGQPLWLRIPPGRVDEATAMMEQRRRGESFHCHNTERLTKAGKLIEVSVNVSPIKDSSGQLVGASTIVRDVSEQNLKEEAGRASELRYRRLFESARDGILIMDGNPHRIIDVNPYVIEMLGYSKEELLGKELWQIGTADDVNAAKAASHQLQSQGYVRYENLPLEASDGTLTHVEVVANSYREGARHVVQCNIRDITERQHAAEVLTETNQCLERTLAELKGKTSDLTAMTNQLWQTSKLATMGELAASIAHELNNPLQTILLRIDSLADGVSHDEKKVHEFEIITGELDRMGQLIGNLLKFSRHSHQEISLLDIRKEIDNSLELIEYHLRAHKIEVLRDFEAGLPDIQADRQQLRQILLNVLTNASDAMPLGGKLLARLRSAESESGVRGVSLKFTDSGTGISPVDFERIWEPFFTTKPEGKGTGLGLAISRRAIEAHHGTLTIESQLGQGTTVTIFLPISNGQKD
jgi:PAS domain S-box-containing protein